MQLDNNCSLTLQFTPNYRMRTPILDSDFILCIVVIIQIFFTLSYQFIVFKALIDKMDLLFMFALLSLKAAYQMEAYYMSYLYCNNKINDNFSYYNQILFLSILYYFLVQMYSQNIILPISLNNSPNKKYDYCIFDNQRVEATLSEITRQSKTVHKSVNILNKSKQNINYEKQTFRKFIKHRKCFKKTSKQRQNFVLLKQEMQEVVLELQKKYHNIELKQFYRLKQKIMLRFLNSYIDDISKQNLDKAQLLVLVWNNLFLLVQKTLQKFCQNQKIKQKNNLIQQTETHKRYQNFLSQNIKEKQQIKQQNQKKQKFMKILVGKLREYKKQVKKMEDNLRIAAQKLNEFRRGYLEIQIQCINLTMQLKNLSEESAKGMIQKKMALALQKTKQYKILPSKKKMKKQLKAEAINSDSVQNVKVKQQFYEAFKGNMNQKAQNIPKIVGRLIETILDKEQSQLINYAIFNENLVEDKFLKEEDMVDKSTDMQGFFIDKIDKKVFINAQQRFYYGMTKMRGVQTQQIQKPHPIKTQNFIIQCDFKQLKSNKLSIKKVIDLSFLFENTFKSSNAKGRQNLLLKSIKQIPLQRTRKRLIQKDPQFVTPFKFNQALSENSNEDSENDKNNLVQNQYNINIISQGSNKPSQGQMSRIADSSGRKRIKKLASTFTNKVSFLNSIGKQFQKRYSKIQSNDGLSNGQYPLILKQIIKQEILSIQQRQQNQSLNKNSKSQNKIQLDLQNINKNKKKKYKKQTETSAPKYSKSLQKSHQKIKSKNESSLSMIKNNQVRNLAENLEKRIPRQSTLYNGLGKQSISFTNPIKKQFDINFQQFYEQVCQQLEKVRNIIINGDKTSSKIKIISKTIQSIFQVAYKDFLSTKKVKRFLYYLHQTINSSYGLTNGTYLHKKVINFIKETFQHRNYSKVFRLFLMMVQVDEKGQHIIGYSSKNNEIILKLLQKVCNGIKNPLKLDELKMNYENLWEGIRQIFNQNGISDSVSYEVIKNAQQANILSYSSKCEQLFGLLFQINRYISNRQNTIIVSYEPISNLICKSDQDMIPKQFVQFIIQLQFVKPQLKFEIESEIQALFENGERAQIDRAQFAYFCFRKQINDFSRLYYRGLAAFELKQNEQMVKNITIGKIKNRKLGMLPQSIIQVIIKQCQCANQQNALFHGMVKKNLLSLLYLKLTDIKCEQMLKTVIGDNLDLIYRAPALGHCNKAGV